MKTASLPFPFSSARARRALVLLVSILAGIVGGGLPGGPGGPTPARAGSVEEPPRGGRGGRSLEVVSPDVHQTYAFGTTTRYLLLWDARQRVLLARVTVANTREADWEHPRVEENLNFRLPGVSLDEASGVFSARDRQGRRAIVAVLRHDFFGAHVVPTVGTFIHVNEPEGLVHVYLTADPAAPAAVDRASHWLISSFVNIV